MKRYLLLSTVLITLFTAEGLFPLLSLGSWVKTNGPVGGIGYDVRLHPVDPDIMFVTDNFAGVIKSIDAGGSWSSENSGINVKGGPTGDS